MGLLGEVIEASVPPSHRCRVAQVIDELGEEGSELQQAFDDPRATIVAIKRVLDRRGLIVGEHQLRKHRKGDCGCAGG